MSPIETIKSNLTQARARLNHVFDQVGSRWDTQVYSDGAAWTVRQLAIHLMISDKGQNATVMGIARGEEGVPADFDLERYNRRSVEKRAEATIEEVRAALATSFGERVAWLDALDEAALTRTGRHGSMQIMSVAAILNLMADHERTHAADIAKALKIE
ncbi:MAG: DinB family protein [Anaerolineae bacterium]|nr:DinB family protein [Anaerolineae bacterium]